MEYTMGLFSTEWTDAIKRQGNLSPVDIFAVDHSKKLGYISHPTSDLRRTMNSSWMSIWRKKKKFINLLLATSLEVDEQQQNFYKFL